MINEALAVVATMAFYLTARGDFAPFPPAARCLVLTAIYTMLNEALLRNLVMDVVVSRD